MQTEFAEERVTLRDYLRGDALMRRFFEVFVFEDVPATDRHPDRLYLDEVEKCDIYIGLFGTQYGSVYEDNLNLKPSGKSPTEQEFDRATELGKYRLIYIRGRDNAGRHPKMQALISRVESDLIRKRFSTASELLAGVYAALVDYLADKQLIRSGPFDASPCMKADISDLDSERIEWFIRTARSGRHFPLSGDVSVSELLKHLNLMDGDYLTNAAVLLFGKKPQRFLISSEIKCARFHGTEVRKPIPSYQVYKGTVFELVDQAVDFVLSKIDLYVGTRENGSQAPVRYEIPKEVVAEAIVNAVAHRDYASNGSVQVMLFSDRLEIWNPGALPPSLTLEKLRVAHGSVPENPLLAEPMYLTKYIERMGTGTGDMIRRCIEAGLPEPEFTVTDGFRTVIHMVKAEEKPSEKTESTREKTESTREKTESTREETESTREKTESTREKTESTREETESTRDKTESTRDKTEETREKIITLISENPFVTMDEMAQKTGISSKGVEWQIKQLKNSGRIKRSGPKKGGHWEIAGDGSN
ncbi:ATP-binding protein [Methanoplanus endosymbiosus]|uniref:DUF4062 domain-containing protein n=1 Tax=Methanoplanus endosymbiosus TaxID=33865 RepID=A0A9E7PQJ3_9EURY|nr:ATP-binding protein [Methanoplanus endosymbiosus]UUX93144.1 DUF4062 domain-containing protein [Methanoplanus endosymbiosus]